MQTRVLPPSSKSAPKALRFRGSGQVANPVQKGSVVAHEDHLGAMRPLHPKTTGLEIRRLWENGHFFGLSLRSDPRKPLLWKGGFLDHLEKGVTEKDDQSAVFDTF